MKTYIKAGLAAAIISMALSSCIKSYEDYNTNPDAVQVVDVKSYITTMEMDALIPCSDEGPMSSSVHATSWATLSQATLHLSRLSTEVHIPALTTWTEQTTTTFLSQ